MAPHVRLFSSHLDPRTGAISRWVAGSSSTNRLIFLSYLSEVNLHFGGRYSIHELYVLTLYSSRFQNPVKEYAIRRRVTRKVARLQSQSTKQDLTTIQEVDTSLLIENREVSDAIQRLRSTVGHDDFPTRQSRGWGSQVDRCFLCASSMVDPIARSGPGAPSGAVEIETTVYCSDAADLKLHSIFRVEEPLGP